MILINNNYWVNVKIEKQTHMNGRDQLENASAARIAFKWIHFLENHFYINSCVFRICVLYFQQLWPLDIGHTTIEIAAHKNGFGKKGSFNELQNTIQSLNIHAHYFQKVIEL